MLETVLDQIPEKVKGLIQDHKDDIIQAWSHNKDWMGFNVDFFVRIFVENNQNKCDVCISFVKEKIKDSASFTWDDKQTELKFDK